MTINTVDNYTSLTVLQQATLSQSITGVSAAANTPAGTGGVPQVASTGGDSVQLSGPAQLLGQLQQLQAQDPTQLTQLLGNIATQLQTAAGQTTGIASDFLTNLANQFQNAATTGNLSALEHAHHAHHAHHAQQAQQPQGTYNQSGQVAAPTLTDTTGLQALAGTAPTDGVNFSQLFTNITQQIAQTVGL